MKQLSYWGRDHKIASRVLIVTAYLILNILGLFIGDMLDSLGIIMNEWVYVITAGVAIFGILYYPRQKNRDQYANYYFRRKTADTILVLTTFVFVIFTGNRLNRPISFISNNAVAASIVPSIGVATPLTKEVTKEIPVTKKAERKNFKQWVKEIRKKYKEQGNGTKVLLIVLAVLGGLAVSYGMIGLGCHIACTGSETLGYIVAILGVAGAVFGTVKLIQNIIKRHQAKNITGKRGKAKPSPIS